VNDAARAYEISYIEDVCRKNWTSMLPVVITVKGRSNPSELIPEVFPESHEVAPCPIVVIRFSQGTHDSYEAAAAYTAIRLLKTLRNALFGKDQRDWWRPSNWSGKRTDAAPARIDNILKAHGWTPETSLLFELQLDKLASLLDQTAIIITLPNSLPPRDAADRAMFDVVLSALSKIRRGCLIAVTRSDKADVLDITNKLAAADLSSPKFFEFCFDSYLGIGAAKNESVFLQGLRKLFLKQIAAVFRTASVEIIDPRSSKSIPRREKVRRIVMLLLLVAYASKEDEKVPQHEALAQAMLEISIGLRPSSRSWQDSDIAAELTGLFEAAYRMDKDRLEPSLHRESAFASVDEARAFVAQFSDFDASSEEESPVCRELRGLMAGWVEAFEKGGHVAWSENNATRGDDLIKLAMALTPPDDIIRASEYLGWLCEFHANDDTRSESYRKASMELARRANAPDLPVERKSRLRRVLSRYDNSIFEDSEKIEGAADRISDVLKKNYSGDGNEYWRVERKYSEAVLRVRSLSAKTQSLEDIEGTLEAARAECSAIRGLFEDIRRYTSDQGVHTLSITAACMAWLWTLESLAESRVWGSAWKLRAEVDCAQMLASLKRSIQMAAWFQARQLPFVLRPNETLKVAISYKRVPGERQPADEMRKKILDGAPERTREPASVKFDTHKEFGSEEWSRNLYCLFSTADIIVCIVDRGYSTSPWCNWEAMIARLRFLMGTATFRLVWGRTEALRVGGQMWQVPPGLAEINPVAQTDGAAADDRDHVLNVLAADICERIEAASSESLLHDPAGTEHEPA